MKKALLLTILSVVALAGTLTAQATAPVPLFSDDFNEGKLDTSKWKVATYPSPDSHPDVNDGQYVADSLDFSHGMLEITTTQPRNHSGHRGAAQRSFGGAIISKDRFGYGTYEFVMRMSTTSPTPGGKGGARSGSVSSGFLYWNKSESEIDLEFLGNDNAIWVTTWKNTNLKQAPKPPFEDIRQETQVENDYLAERFCTYRIEWTPKRVKVYIDDTLVAEHTHHVPSAPAQIILQHRGTNSDKWGGEADINNDHYFYVKSVSFTPMP